MKQVDFEGKYQPSWQAFSSLLDQLEGRQEKSPDFAENSASFPKQYRIICQHLSLAQGRNYSPAITEHLHSLVLRGHQYLYRNKRSIWQLLSGFIASDFPRALRLAWRPWLLSSVMFYLPFLFMAIMCFNNGDFIRTIMDYDAVQRLEYMYNPETEKTGRSSERQSDSDFYMFGHYVMNNVGIDFRTYASGILFGIGSAFFMIFNGLYIGAAAGHLTQLGYSETFWSFVAGHSALELTAATISGGAGLKLGYALINPGRYRRLLALKIAGKESIPLISGAALMTLLAAFVEGFWSATPWVSNEIKYAVGISGWIAVFYYLLLAGRKA